MIDFPRVYPFLIYLVSTKTPVLKFVVVDKYVKFTCSNYEVIKNFLIFNNIMSFIVIVLNILSPLLIRVNFNEWNF